jgi:TRAP-type mannitol/chloroaromatic compound transport system substrate-binding protein
MSWTRRALLKTSTTLGIGLSSSSFLGGNPQKKPRFKWRLVLAVPRTMPIWGEEVVGFAQNILRITEGDFEIQVYGAGELMPALNGFDGVQSGQVEMGHSAAYYWQGKLPSSVFFAAIPFGLDAQGAKAWILAGEGQDLWDELYKPHGLLALPAGSTGAQMGGWYRKPLTKPEDFRGLKIRIPGLGGAVLSQLGASPVVVPSGEILTQLVTGVLDGAEWVGPYHDTLLGLPKAAPYYYYPGWQEPGPILELLIHRRAWDRLPESFQGLLRSEAAFLDQRISARWLAEDSKALELLEKDPGISIQAFSPPILKAIKEASQRVRRDLAQTSPLAKKISQSYETFENRYRRLLGVTLKPYYDSL